MVAPLTFSLWVQSIREFQQLGLLNKALIDATAVDIPLVVLANNQKERKERFFRQLLVFCFAFLLAPLHAKGLSQLFSRRFTQIPAPLRAKFMQIPYQQLLNDSSFQTGVAAIINSGTNKIKQWDILRKQVLQAKINTWSLDLALEGLLFSSVGFLKVWFGTLITGKKQFTGEMTAVSGDALNALYQQEKNKPAPDNMKKAIITIGLSVGLPLLIGGLLKLGFNQKVGKALSGWIQKRLAPLLDYNYAQSTGWLKGWPLLSDASLLLTALILTAGELSSARSQREFKELFIQRNSIDVLFFFGVPLFMKLLTGSTTVDGAIKRVQQINKAMPKSVQAVGTHAAKAYILSYGLALAAVAATVVWTNQITTKAVQKAAEQLKQPWHKLQKSNAVWQIFNITT